MYLSLSQNSSIASWRLMTGDRAEYDIRQVEAGNRKEKSHCQIQAMAF
jgi:hypothetical protein